MPFEFFQVDAFTDVPFRGNPAAVFVLSDYPPDAFLQAVGREMNLSETAFVVPDEDGRFLLRWFTPVTEVDLCGHATLAASHVVFSRGLVPEGRAARFDTRSGELAVDRSGSGTYLMDFPVEAAAPIADVPGLGGVDDLRRVLGSAPVWVGANRMDLLVEMRNEAEVRALDPDMSAVGRIGLRGVIVTARSEGGDQDFVSRFFAPQCGVPEDPVTGSAHCALAPFWAERLGKDRLVGWQASPRGGRVGMTIRGDRVELEGQAVTVATGTLYAGPAEAQSD